LEFASFKRKSYDYESKVNKARLKISCSRKHYDMYIKTLHCSATPAVAGEALFVSPSEGADDSRFSVAGSLYHTISKGFPCNVLAPRARATSASRRFLNCTIIDSTSSLYDTASNCPNCYINGEIKLTSNVSVALHTVIDIIPQNAGVKYPCPLADSS